MHTVYAIFSFDYHFLFLHISDIMGVQRRPRNQPDSDSPAADRPAGRGSEFQPRVRDSGKTGSPHRSRPSRLPDVRSTVYHDSRVGGGQSTGRLTGQMTQLVVDTRDK